jgi:hypothetical protein
MLGLLLEAALRSLALGAAAWVVLALLRIRDPRVQMTAWTVVLVASLSMPLIMDRITLTLPPAIPSSPLAKIVELPPASEPVPAAKDVLPPPAASFDRDTLQPRREAPLITLDPPTTRQIDWLALATVAYVLVAGVMLLRLLTGIVLTWRLAQAARPIDDAAGLNVRVSDAVNVPVTFASTILLPPGCHDWSPAKRQAVLSHERSHVVHGDCYVLLLAALNRAVFWFSPFAWWQLARLAELAEMISDDAAIEVVADRRSYAEVLLDLAGDVPRAPASLAMARAGTVGRRVDRILAATAVPSRAGARRQLIIAALLAPVVAICAASVVRSTRPPAAAIASKAEPAAPANGQRSPASVSLDPQRLDSYAGYYRFDSGAIFAVTRKGDQPFAQLTGEGKLPIFPAGEREFLYKAAARITFPGDGELIVRQHGAELRAVRVAGVPNAAQPPVKIDPSALDSFVGWYQLSPFRVLALTREGDRLFAQVTGRPRFELLARSEASFASADGNIFVVFPDPASPGAPEMAGGANKLLLHDPVFGARDAARIDAGRAAAIQAVFGRLVAEAPDRFKEQTPAPGGSAALLQAIADLQQDAPRYDRMSPQLVDGVRRNASELHAILTALGAAEEVFFRGVGPWGYDIYGAKFARGFAEFRVLMGADGRLDDLVVRPDGDGTPGGFAACADEPTLKATSGTAPIKVLLYNGSGADIQLFELDGNGKRIPYAAIGDERTVPIQTYVTRPWVVADETGQCRAIMLPGQRARFLNVPPAQAGEPRVGTRRSTPMPGSEEALRRYIEALLQGRPDYDQMTPEVAAQTRRDLLLNQAILAKLGALRAVSFRGATQFGNDIYMTHFANGAAEWRIGLVKQGRIGRIALGPQY